MPVTFTFTKNKKTRASDDASSEKRKEVDSRLVPEQDILSIWKMYPKPRGSKTAGISAIKLALNDLLTQGYQDPVAGFDQSEDLVRLGHS